MQMITTHDSVAALKANQIPAFFVASTEPRKKHPSRRRVTNDAGVP